MYCPILGQGIGVLVSSSPFGPFADPIGKPLVKVPDTWQDIDPTMMDKYICIVATKLPIR